MKNNQKIISSIVLVLVVIAIISIAGYSAWSKKANTNITKSPSTETDTSNWKTYKNIDYGFEFKYPIDTLVKYNDKYINDGSQELISLKSIKDYQCGSSFDEISFSIVNSTSRDVAPQGSEQGTYFGKNGFRYYTGSESSAVDNYYIQLSDSQTLVINGGETCRIKPNEKGATIDDVISTIKFTPSPVVTCVPEGESRGAPRDEGDFCCSGLIRQPISSSGTVFRCVKP